MEHPDHQTGMVSEEMLRARMCEEAGELRAELERLRARVAVLEQALGLLTTLAPKMEIDTSDPLGMAKTIEATVRAALEVKP
jgi:hypothetical protein